MRRWTKQLAACAVVGLAFFAQSTRAQEKEKFETVRFDTVDGVELKGAYWPSTKLKKGPVAILLHKIGANSRDQGWKDLSEELHKAGFGVLSFDFRGHGESTSVGATFWKHPMNAMVKGHKPFGQEQPKSVSVRDFPATYLPNLINDIAAAKRFLERRFNDAGECNCSNIVLIGAEDGATLGALWLASETKRYRILPVGMTGQKAERPESKDVVACVWLNMSNKIGTYNVGNALRGWIKEAGNTRDSKIPMAFMFGKMDKAQGDYAVSLVKVIRGANYVPGKKPADNDELKGSVEYGVPNLKLVGAKLLTEPGTRESIVKNYLNGFILDEKKGLNEWEKRESESSLFGWYFPSSLKPVLTNALKEKHMIPVPLRQFGLQ